MKKVKIAINGLGRIGRLMLKEVIGHESIELVAVNDISNPEILAHLINWFQSMVRMIKQLNGKSKSCL